MNAIASKPKPAKRGKAAIRAPQLPKPIEDGGLALRYARGEVVVDRTAADPANPNRTIARARVKPHYERMRDKGRLTREQFEAASYYAELVEIEAGARWSNGERNGAAAPPWMRQNATVAQLHALGLLRTAREAVGRGGRGMLDMLVIQDRTIIEICRAYAVPNRKTGRREPLDEREVYGSVKAILTRLSEHWGTDIGNLPRGVE